MTHPNSNSNPDRSIGGWILGVVVCVAAAVFLFREERRQEVPETPRSKPAHESSVRESEAVKAPMGTPLERADQGYVGAEQCRTCHEDEHHTWHNSYHRTMTQRATPETVIGDFDVTLRHGSNNPPVRLSREGEAFWMELVGQQIRDEQGIRPARFPISMTTGSHHMQVYWAPIGRSRTVVNVPFVYLRASREWIPWGSCFLQPPTESSAMSPGVWNGQCVHCHTTHGQPKKLSQPGAFETVAAEFGISCEACHGPGEQHVAYREANPEGAAENDPVVNPATMDHRRSSQVCGACHSFSTARMHVSRPEFRPGQDLHAMRQVIRFDAAAKAEIRAKTEDKALAEQAIEKMSHMFWPDGIARVTGREYTGMMDSACHVEGTMSCVSCHQLHQSKKDPRTAEEWANDQLSHRRMGNGACTQCHEAKQFESVAHTHHAPASAGSECMNCHMPHTSWGLLRGLRSHRVDSPDLVRDRAAGRPNACNLCHLDKSIGWSADHMVEWYGTKKPELSEEEEEIASGVLWTLKGDAGVRALMAWHLAWPPAQKASGADWVPPYLALLLGDDYDAVRYVARRSIKTFSGYGDLVFDYLGSREHRDEVVGKVIAQWQKDGAGLRAGNDALLINGRGELKQAEVDRLLTRRDIRPIYLIE